VYCRHSRFQFQSPVQAPQSIVEPPSAIQNSCEVHLNRWSQRIELLGAFHVGDGFRETSELAQEKRVGVVRIDIVGIYKRVCLVCHQTDMVEQQRLSKAAWVREIGKMIRWGATVGDAEKDLLTDYLAARFGPR
jgi:hypothetical protein